MSAIPEDSVLRRHYLANSSRRQTVSKSSAPSPSPQYAQSATSTQVTQTSSGGILGFIKRLFGG
ncbi:MAG: hypothetical protein V3V18_03550 [Methylococcales bacterium]